MSTQTYWINVDDAGVLSEEYLSRAACVAGAAELYEGDPEDWLCTVLHVREEIPGDVNDLGGLREKHADLILSTETVQIKGDSI